MLHPTIHAAPPEPGEKASQNIAQAHSELLHPTPSGPQLDAG